MIPATPSPDEIAARLAKATPGPWTATEDEYEEDEFNVWQGREFDWGWSLDYEITHGINGEKGEANADLIANAPTDIAFLLGLRDAALKLHHVNTTPLLGQVGCAECDHHWPCATARALGVEA